MPKRDNNGSANEEQTPMQHVQTPQIPTTQQRDSGDRRIISEESNTKKG